MSDVDRQPISTVKLLETLGYTFSDGQWHGAASEAFAAEADLMHGLLVTRADAIEGFTEGSPEEAETPRLPRWWKPMRPSAGDGARAAR